MNSRETHVETVLYSMKNLKAYHENGYQFNYVAFFVDRHGEIVAEVACSKRAAYNKLTQGGQCPCDDVLTFRQAAKKYPYYFEYK